jgi:ParB-like chromosome segregation protein Spo0J
MSPVPKKAARPQGTLEFHSFASAFPLLNGDEFKEFAADIKAHGLDEEIVLYQGKILDGRNRYRACLNAKVEPKFKQFEGDDAAARAFVISANAYRRHLKAKDKRVAIAAALKASPEKSDRLIAEMTKSSPTTVSTIRREVRRETETESTVQSGQLPPKRVGKDGKARKPPAPKERRETSATQKEIIETAEKVKAAAIRHEIAVKEAAGVSGPSAPNEVLELLREFASFVIYRFKVDPKDYAEWRGLKGRVRAMLGDAAWDAA